MTGRQRRPCVELNKRSPNIDKRWKVAITPPGWGRSPDIGKRWKAAIALPPTPTTSTMAPRRPRTLHHLTHQILPSRSRLCHSWAAWPAVVLNHDCFRSGCFRRIGTLMSKQWDRNKQMFRARGCCHLWAHHGVSNTVGAASAAGQTM